MAEVIPAAELHKRRIAAAIARAVQSTPNSWEHGIYIHRLSARFEAAGFRVKRQQPVPWRGTPDGRSGRLSMVLEGYAAIEVDGYLPHPHSVTKLLQAPAGCTVLAVILRLGAIPPEEWDYKYVPNSHLAQTTTHPTITHPAPLPLAIQHDIQVISAPLP